MTEECAKYYKLKITMYGTDKRKILEENTLQTARAWGLGRFIKEPKYTKDHTEVTLM